jgi:hypothetical protein
MSNSILAQPLTNPASEPCWTVSSTNTTATLLPCMLAGASRLNSMQSSNMSSRPSRTAPAFTSRNNAATASRVCGLARPASAMPTYTLSRRYSAMGSGTSLVWQARAVQ